MMKNFSLPDVILATSLVTSSIISLLLLGGCTVVSVAGSVVSAGVSVGSAAVGVASTAVVGTVKAGASVVEAVSD